MVLSDFDRTLSDERNNFVINYDVARVVNEFSKEHLFFVVTGRERKFINILAKGLFPTGWIIENGAIIILKDKEIKLVDKEWYSIREEVSEVLVKHGIRHSLGEVIIYVDSVGSQKDKLELLNLEVKIEWNRNDAMIMPKQVGKGNAVKTLKEIIGFRGKTIGIGDSQNDISLFEAVDIKVAVRNALPEIKNMADIVLDKDDGEGVKDFLLKIIENELRF